MKISFKTHNIQHDIKNNSVLNYALSPKVSFHLSLIGLKIRKRNSSLSHHYTVEKLLTKYKLSFPNGSPHMKITKWLEERTPMPTVRLKFRNKLLL